MTEVRSAPYLILEIANTHAGSVDYVRRLIQQFDLLDYEKKGIKFQIFSPETFALPDYEWFPVYEKLFIDEAQWGSFINDASQCGDVWIDIFDTYGIEVLSKNLSKVRGIKIQASVLDNLEVKSALSDIYSCEKAIIINVASKEISEIDVLMKEFKMISKDVIIQIGFQSYPTRIEDTGLRKIGILKHAFPGAPVCLADHLDGDSPMAKKVATYGYLLGAEYIEKHFCLVRDEAKYDGFSSLELEELSEVSEDLKSAAILLSGDFINPSEKDYLSKTIQIPVLSKDMNRGELVGKGDLHFRRTGQDGLSAEEISEIQRGGQVLKDDKCANSALRKEDFRKANVAAIVACRMKSLRLPRKAILPIGGIPSVERCLLQCKAITGLDHVILATSDLHEDQILEAHAQSVSAEFWAGDPVDVISRYLGAIDFYKVDIIVRITADNPLVLPEIIEFLLQSHFASGADYTAAEQCAVGTSGEIISTNALRRVSKYFNPASHSEYMTWYFRNNPDHFKINIAPLPSEWVNDYRMTLDYQEDMEMFESLYSEMGNSARHYSLSAVFETVANHPEIPSTNGHLNPKYEVDDELIKTLDRETKIK